MHTKLTNIVSVEKNVRPFVGEKNKLKNALKANNAARADEKGLTTKNDSYVHRFVEILFEEAALENIRPDIVFAQMMLETGWLTYGYDVRENQNNFGGIGATGGGARGNLFLGIREGIRVNVQHLKAYASLVPLNGPVADPRFGFVTRGTATWVEHLGYHENPKGFGWAMGRHYGFVIMDIIRRLDSASPEPFQVTAGPVEITDYEVGSIIRDCNNLDIKFTQGFAPGQEVRLGLGTNSDSEHRFVILNQTTGESITTSWSENRAVLHTPMTAGLYQLKGEIRQKGTTALLDSRNLEMGIGDMELTSDPD